MLLRKFYIKKETVCDLHVRHVRRWHHSFISTDPPNTRNSSVTFSTRINMQVLLEWNFVVRPLLFVWASECTSFQSQRRRCIPKTGVPSRKVCGVQLFRKTTRNPCILHGFANNFQNLNSRHWKLPRVSTRVAKRKPRKLNCVLQRNSAIEYRSVIFSMIRIQWFNFFSNLCLKMLVIL